NRARGLPAPGKDPCRGTVKASSFPLLATTATAVLGLTITPAAKKVIYQPDAPARDPVRFPRWRVGLICSSMRNFLAGVIFQRPRTRLESQGTHDHYDDAKLLSTVSCECEDG